MFIHQLAREVWWYESPFPLNALGFWAEPQYLRLYRNVPVVTVSESTRRDLMNLGLKGSITVIPEGIEEIEATTSIKTSAPTFLYVGRLAPSKRIGHILQALALFHQRSNVGTLWLVGSGPGRYQRRLMRIVKRLGLESSVLFYGRVSAQRKHELMAAATALVLTSVREGWGLVVSESNACGTPAIVYDVPGLRDSVRHESTGLVVAPRPRLLADAMERIWKDRGLYQSLTSEAVSWSRNLSFDATERAFLDALQETVRLSKTRAVAANDA